MPEHFYKTFPNDVTDKTFRCQVHGKTRGTLQIGGRVHKIDVRETSGSGFTLGLSPKIARKVKCGKRYELRFDDRRIQVQAQTFTESVQGEARLQVRTIREFEPKERWAFRLPFMRGKRISSHESTISSGAAYGGFVLVLFCVLSLPGVGEKLGTAPRIHHAIELIEHNFSDVYRSFTK